MEHAGRRFFFAAVAFEASLAALAWGLGAWWKVDLWTMFRWRWQALALGVLASGPLIALFFLAVRYRTGPLQRIWDFLTGVIQPALEGCTLLQLFVLALVAGLAEEMLFRGVLLPAIDRVAQRWIVNSPDFLVGLMISSVVFGLAHAITPTYALLAALVGLYLGWLLVSSDNLLAPVTTHALYDLAALVYLRRAGRRV